MSSYPFRLPTQHTLAIKPAILPARTERVEVWLFTALLLLGLGVVCLNSPPLTGIWQLLLFVFAMIVALRPGAAISRQAAFPLLAASSIPVWGAIELLLHRVAYPYASLVATIQWSVLPACLLLGLALFRSGLVRRLFFHALAGTAAAITALELFQLFLYGRYRVTFSGLPLISSNLYAELAELMLPVVLATSLRKGEHLWRGCGLVAFMAGTTIASGARMGSTLVLLEIGAVLLFTRSRPGYLKLSWKLHAIPLVSMLVIAIGLEGTSLLSQRLFSDHMFQGRSEVSRSAEDMIAVHPVLGYGLGSFPVVYPQFTHLDTRYYINHVHNDYLEILAESGVVGLGLWGLTLAFALPAVARAPWAFGVLAILIHSSTDFPLYRSPVVALFAMLIAAALSRRRDREDLGSVRTKSRSSD